MAILVLFRLELFCYRYWTRPLIAYISASHQSCILSILGCIVHRSLFLLVAVILFLYCSEQRVGGYMPVFREILAAPLKSPRYLELNALLRLDFWLQIHGVDMMSSFGFNRCVFSESRLEPNDFNRWGKPISKGLVEILKSEIDYKLRHWLVGAIKYLIIIGRTLIQLALFPMEKCRGVRTLMEECPTRVPYKSTSKGRYCRDMNILKSASGLKFSCDCTGLDKTLLVSYWALYILGSVLS